MWKAPWRQVEEESQPAPKTRDRPWLQPWPWPGRPGPEPWFWDLARARAWPGEYWGSFGWKHFCGNQEALQTLGLQEAIPDSLLTASLSGPHPARPPLSRSRRCPDNIVVNRRAVSSEQLGHSFDNPRSPTSCLRLGHLLYRHGSHARMILFLYVSGVNQPRPINLCCCEPSPPLGGSLELQLSDIVVAAVS